MLQAGLKEEANRKLFEEYLHVNALTAWSAKGRTVEEELEKLEEKIRAEQGSGSSGRMRFLRYAAVFALVLGGVTLFRLFQEAPPVSIDSPTDENAVTVVLDDGSAHEIEEGKTLLTTEEVISAFEETTSEPVSEKAEAPVYHKLYVPYGKRIQLKLSDNTLVYMNSGSSLRYPKSFVEGYNREVFLEGEAYFKVTRNEKAPFIVNASEMDVRVLGTEFNVSSYKGEEQVAVLVEGSVEVSAKNGVTPKRMVPGQAARLRDRELALAEVDVYRYTAWINGELVFDDQKFETILNTLERFYNVEINNTYKDLNEIKYNGRFDIESIEQVLNSFMATGDFDYEINKNQIIIKKPGE